MNPERLAVDELGRPLITLMRSPDGENAFLSVVKAGANGRTFRVTKADAMPDDLPPVNAVGAFQGVRGLGLMARLFQPLFALFSTPVEKSDPVTFNAAIQAPKLGELLWQTTDALREVIRNILADDAIGDKSAAYGQAIDQMKAYLLGELAKVPVAKAAEVAGLLEQRTAVEKAGKILSARNAAVVRQARDALAALLASAGVADDPEVSPSQVVKEVPVNIAQLTQAAEAAGLSAVAVAKAANPSVTPADLVRIGTEAAASVWKAAVAGPPQPGLPSGELARQIAEASAGSGSPPNPTDAFSAAIAGLRMDVMKAVEAVGAEVKAIKVEIGGDDGKGGLREVVAKSLEVSRALARIPARPNGTPATDGAAASGRTPVAKGDGETSYEGTALGPLAS